MTLSGSAVEDVNSRTALSKDAETCVCAEKFSIFIFSQG